MNQVEIKLLPKIIAVVIYDFEPRGVQRAQVRLANEFLEMGFKVDALVFSAHGPLASSLENGVRVIKLGASSAKGAFFSLFNYLRTIKPDVVFSAEDHVNVIFLLARLLSARSTRYSVSCHVSPGLWAKNAKAGQKSWFLKKLVSLLYPSSDQCVVLSSGMAEEYSRIFGLKQGRSRVIYNPVLSDSKTNTTEPSVHTWLHDEKLKVIVAVGNLSRIKGFDVLIRAFAELQDRENSRLLLIGDGPEKANLADLVQEHLLTDYVDLVGFHPDPELFMSNADLFVLSSRSEGLPTVLIEALGCGCPVVATRCGGGTLEIMEDGRLGPLVDVDDIQGLAVAMRQVLDDPPNRAMLRTSAQRFRSDVVARQYLENLLS